MLAATQHVWLGSTWNVPSAKEEVHGLFILDEVEMASFRRELPCGQFLHRLILKDVMCTESVHSRYF